MKCTRPLLAALALAALCLAPTAAQAASWSAAAGPKAPLVRPLSANEHTVLALLNQIRLNHHLKPFRLSLRLTRSSRFHSAEMLHFQYFEHDSINSGTGWYARIRRFLPLYYEGENIGWGSADWSAPADMVDAWMHSPDHRRNILDPEFTQIGVGIRIGRFLGDPNAWLYTTDFAGNH